VSRDRERPTRADLAALIARTPLPPHIKALGLTQRGRRPALFVVTYAGSRALSALSSVEAQWQAALPNVPMVVRETPGPLRAAYLPRPQGEALTPEQEVLDPVTLGAQIQNGAADERLGDYGVGTLGAFYPAPEGGTLLLSNNHVIAAESTLGEENARVGDPIYQAQRGRGRVVARLSAWVPLSQATPNHADLASAALLPGTAFENAFLPSRGCPALGSTTQLAAPRVGQQVFKVGRTSGLTFGTVSAVSARVPRVEYGFGGAAFENSLIIEGLNGSTFSAPGDSGSGIYDRRGRLVGFLYAGDGTITLACPAQASLEALGVLASGALR
jgi:hypothetical protein